MKHAFHNPQNALLSTHPGGHFGKEMADLPIDKKFLTIWKNHFSQWLLVWFFHSRRCPEAPIWSSPKGVLRSLEIAKLPRPSPPTSASIVWDIVQARSVFISMLIQSRLEGQGQHLEKIHQRKKLFFLQVVGRLGSWFFGLCLPAPACVFDVAKHLDKSKVQWQRIALLGEQKSQNCVGNLDLRAREMTDHNAEIYFLIVGTDFEGQTIFEKVARRASTLSEANTCFEFLGPGRRQRRGREHYSRRVWGYYSQIM